MGPIRQEAEEEEIRRSGEEIDRQDVKLVLYRCKGAWSGIETQTERYCGDDHAARVSTDDLVVLPRDPTADIVQENALLVPRPLRRALLEALRRNARQGSAATAWTATLDSAGPGAQTHTGAGSVCSQAAESGSRVRLLSQTAGPVC